ncbi:hypothetical protein ACIBI9_38140 [Nonomuraea sp. NPDC050451]|uniref:hypothetical protein n=1 Tax=Nonomuraea sp. NPDC050451 TaxID=3364364 RepID=UPI0037AAB2B0
MIVLVTLQLHADQESRPHRGRRAVAINNYRQSGGGGFPHVTGAPVLYNAQVEIRQALIEYATAKGTIDPSGFDVQNWKLTRDGVPVF